MESTLKGKKGFYPHADLTCRLSGKYIGKVTNDKAIDNSVENLAGINLKGMTPEEVHFEIATKAVDMWGNAIFCKSSKSDKPSEINKSDGTPKFTYRRYRIKNIPLDNGLEFDAGMTIKVPDGSYATKGNEKPTFYSVEVLLPGAIWEERKHER